MVSYCDRSMSVVRRASSTIALIAYSSYTPGPMDSKLCRKRQVTCRSKIAKIVPIGNHSDRKSKMAAMAMAAILKIYFALLLLNRKADCLETWLEASG